MKHIFGPVASRRLGYSLGVELIPAKTCTYGCIYCQAGKTTLLTDKRAEYIPTKEVIDELEEALPQEGLHYVTFSGSGEPTLHSDIGKIIDKVKTLTGTPICVITNSSLIHRKDVRRDLKKADVVIPSLDSALQESFEKINRPVSGITVDKIINGLIKFRKEFTGQMRLEIMLVKGINDSLEEIARLKEAADRIGPDTIDLNTVVRPPALKTAEASDMQEMKRIQAYFGDLATVISSFDKTAHSESGTSLDDEVFQLARRRGVTLDDLVTGFGLHRDVATDILERLTAEGKVKKVSFRGKTYFRENY